MSFSDLNIGQNFQTTRANFEYASPEQTDTSDMNKGIARNWIGRPNNGSYLIKLPYLYDEKKIEALKKIKVSTALSSSDENYNPAKWSILTLPEGWSADMKNMSFGDCEICICDEENKVRVRMKTQSDYGYHRRDLGLELLKVITYSKIIIGVRLVRPDTLNFLEKGPGSFIWKKSQDRRPGPFHEKTNP